MVGMTDPNRCAEVGRDWMALFILPQFITTSPSFERFPLKQRNYLKNVSREIQFQQVIDIAKIEDIQGYPNLDSYFAFDCLECVWECIKV